MGERQKKFNEIREDINKIYWNLSKENLLLLQKDYLYYSSIFAIGQDFNFMQNSLIYPNSSNTWIEQEKRTAFNLINNYSILSYNKGDFYRTPLFEEQLQKEKEREISFLNSLKQILPERVGEIELLINNIRKIKLDFKENDIQYIIKLASSVFKQPFYNSDSHGNSNWEILYDILSDSTIVKEISGFYSSVSKTKIFENLKITMQNNFNLNESKEIFEYEPKVFAKYFFYQWCKDNKIIKITTETINPVANNNKLTKKMTEAKWKNSFKTAFLSLLNEEMGTNIFDIQQLLSSLKIENVLKSGEQAKNYSFNNGVFIVDIFTPLSFNYDNLEASNNTKLVGGQTYLNQKTSISDIDNFIQKIEERFDNFINFIIEVLCKACNIYLKESPKKAKRICRYLRSNNFKKELVNLLYAKKNINEQELIDFFYSQFSESDKKRVKEKIDNGDIDLKEFKELVIKNNKLRILCAYNRMNAFGIFGELKGAILLKHGLNLKNAKIIGSETVGSGQINTDIAFNSEDLLKNSEIFGAQVKGFYSKMQGRVTNQSLDLYGKTKITFARATNLKKYFPSDIITALRFVLANYIPNRENIKYKLNSSTVNIKVDNDFGKEETQMEKIINNCIENLSYQFYNNIVRITSQDFNGINIFFFVNELIIPSSLIIVLAYQSFNNENNKKPVNIDLNLGRKLLTKTAVLGPNESVNTNLMNQKITFNGVYVQKKIFGVI